MSLINGLAGLAAGLKGIGGNLEDWATPEATPAVARPPAGQDAAPQQRPALPLVQPDAVTPPPSPAVPQGVPGRPNLTTIEAPGGAKVTVAASAAPNFQGLIDDLEKAGYKLDPKTTGGYNPRNIAGTNTPSMHSYGLAMDVNWQKNPQGSSSSDIPPQLANALAEKWGLTWGGNWSGASRDPMHFEISGGRPAPGGSS